ncbi:hypothetical protein [Aestuariivivens sediminis]|uniref:hypothetical protein n=1 Tax=Aestuariivivens sediminis TaxID=2913557 RepID=UPI001F57C6EA|nr:hypothetical protein [Aestuariivivens sediminis]
MLRTTKNINKLLLFAICLIEFALIMASLPVYFELNDDTGMNAIASGAVSGSPSEFLLFTNVIIGYLLKFFFTYVPTVNWYTWYLLSALFMGYFAIQYAFATKNASLWLKIFKHILILALIMTSLLTITFSEVAVVVMIGGILIIANAEHKNHFELGFGLFLMVLGALIRTDVFKMIMLLGVPVFVYLIYSKHYRKLLYIALSVLISFGAMMIDKLVYHNHTEYQEYREFNQIRSKVTASDNSQLFDKMEIFKAMGWGIADVELMASFNLDVGHLKFTKEKLKRVANYDPGLNKKRSLSFLLEHVGISLKTLFDFIKRQTHWLLVFCCILFLLIERKTKALLQVLAYFIYIVLIAVFILIVIEGNLKDHIAFGLLLPLGLMLIYFLSFDRIFKWIGIKHLNYVKTGLIVFCAVVLFIPLLKFNMTKDAIINEFEITEKMHAALEARPEPFYVSWVILQYYPIFNLPFNMSKAYSLGWSAGSPVNKDKIERFTGNRNLGVYTIFNKDIVWYFQNDIYYKLFAKIVYEFYLKTYPNRSFSRELIKVTENKMLIKHTYHIKM